MKKSSVNTQAVEIEESGVEILAHDSASKKTIGFALATMREKKAVDIASVSATLNISERYLWAIENMDRNALPEKVYSLGFVRTYARYLGVDPQKSVDQFKKEVFGEYQAQNLNIPEPLAPIEKPKLALVFSMFAIAVGGWFLYQYLMETPREKSPAAQLKTVDGAGRVDEQTSAPTIPAIGVAPLAQQESIPSSQMMSQSIPVNAVGDQGDGQENFLPIVMSTPDEENAELPLNKSNAQDATVHFLNGKESSKTLQRTSPSESDRGTGELQNSSQNLENPPSAVAYSKLEHVTFSFQEKTWVEIKKGAQVLITKKFLPGESYSFPMSADLTISTLNSKAFTVHYQGEEFSFQTKGEKFNNLPLKLLKEQTIPEISEKSIAQ